jgi:hypothetical protein
MCRANRTGIAAVIAIAAVITISAMALAAGAQDYTVDTAASESLTNYFKQNRLPLVGAQVGKDSAGDRRVVLYGYVATQQGKSDAERKATAFLGAPAPQMVDRIVLQPEIANMHHPDAGGAAGGDALGSANDYAGATAANPNGETFDQVIDAIQRHGVKSPPDDQDIGNRAIGFPY